MTQTYTILWYEDSKDFIASLTNPIREHIEGLGFEFRCENKIDDSELNETWLRKVDPDLILIDYGLGEGKKGDQILEKIRTIERYADVVFYSRNYEDYIQKISRQIDGIFFAIRKDLLAKTTNVISRTVRKQQDPNNMRGVIIAEAIDIERKMENIILICLGPDPERKSVISKVLDPEWEVLSFKKKCDLVNKICKERIKTLNKTHSTAVSPKKEEIEDLLCKLQAKKQILGCVEAEVIKYRNIMAHADQEPETGRLVSYLVKDEPIAVDDNFCKTTRMNLKKHCINLDELTKLLS